LKTKIFIAIIIPVLITLLIITPFVYVQANKLIFAHRVMDYLVQEVGVKKKKYNLCMGNGVLKHRRFLSSLSLKMSLKLNTFTLLTMKLYSLGIG
jgi:hypothetical protein